MPRTQLALNQCESPTSSWNQSSYKLQRYQSPGSSENGGALPRRRGNGFWAERSTSCALLSQQGIQMVWQDPGYVTTAARVPLSDGRKICDELLHSGHSAGHSTTHLILFTVVPDSQREAPCPTPHSLRGKEPPRLQVCPIPVQLSHRFPRC